MAIEFIIEDGTGKTDSTSYVEILEFKQYFENRGKTFTETDDIISTWLNDASNYADLNYNWGGLIFDEDQSLDVPRSNWYDKRGRDISESVPTELKNGVSELAYARQGGSSEASVYENNLKSKNILGISKTYRGASQSDGKKTYPNANSWFSKLTMNNLSERTCR